MGRPPNPLNTLYKICPTCKKEFTCQKRKEKTFCSKTCAANSPGVKEKNRQGVAKAFDSRYGGHPMATNPQTMEKFNATMIERHGKPWGSQTDGWEEKVKATKLERYGDETYNNQEAIKATCIERYGADNYRKTQEYKEKYKATCLKKYGVPHASMQKTWSDTINSSTFKLSHKRAMFKKFYTSEKFKNFVPCFNMDEYDGITIRFNKKYKFKCNRCKKEYEFDLTACQFLRCPECDAFMSIFQTEVVDYIKQILPNEPIVINNRAIINPLELDIYVPNKNIAIETDGIYYHSEISSGRNSNYHLNKTKTCATKGIRLIHVFENDWIHKKDIVKSILKNLLIKENKKIYARNCTVKEITSNQKTEFLNLNNIYGNDLSMVKLGLFHNNELVMVMTLTTAKFSKSITWEINRCASKLNTNIIGGMSKLFKYFIRKYSPPKVISYCDRRYFSGESLLKIGFQFIENTPPEYHYIIDAYDTLENPGAWRKLALKEKLAIFDPALSEWENMKVNGFDRIWDCGHSKWIWVDKTVETPNVITS